MENKIKTLDELKIIFPKGIANEMNFCLFSTSGVHGTYNTIEDLFQKEDYTDSITFVVIQPRVVNMCYGNIYVTPEDVDYLKKLRQSSWDAVSSIGARQAHKGQTND